MWPIGLRTSRRGPDHSQASMFVWSTFFLLIQNKFNCIQKVFNSIRIKNIRTCTDIIRRHSNVYLDQTIEMCI